MEGNDLLTQRLLDCIYSTNVARFTEIEPFGSESLQIYNEQKACQKKAAGKLAPWIEHRCLFAGIPLEQCTSWPVAAYKSQLFSGNTMLDLTGGLGSDDVAFASSFEQITSLDPDSGLNAIFRFNARQMGINNVLRLDSSAEEFLASCTESYDLVYADPDRRASGQRAVADTGSYRPDIFALMGQHARLTRRWLIKLSPMTDLDWIRQRTPFPCRFILFSLKGELKEILLETGPDVTPAITIADVSRRQWLDDKDIECTAVEGESLFMEALPATIKAGFHKTIAPGCGLRPENTGGTFLTGNCLPPEGYFRIFRIREILQGSLNNMASRLKALKITSANITVREFTNSADETRKILALKDGGEDYLFFTGKGKEKTCFVCRKPGQDFFSELAR